MRRFAAIALAGVIIGVLSGGCDADHAASDVDDVAAPIHTPSPTITMPTLGARGQIVSQQAVDPPFADPDDVIGEARLATYRTVSGVDGSERAVSGVFVIPRGTPAPGGWPVISFAHGTTGIANDCGPSRDPKLLGFLSTVRDLAANGYAVAFTDYEGLGTPGSHPYLEPRSAAFDVIDAVRAIRNIFPDVSNRWLAFGNSQGGQASWAANEAAGTYGDGLDLVGVVSTSPAVNLTPLAQRGAMGRLTPDQEALIPTLVAGLERYDPELKARNLLSDAVRADENSVFTCKPNASSLVPYPHIAITDPGAVDTLRDGLRRIALPQGQLSAPMLVVNGLADETIAAPWVSTAVNAACASGGRIQHVEVAGAGHADLGAAGYGLIYRWMHDRFVSAPPSSTCGQASQQIAVS